MVADRARRLRGDGAVVGADWFRRYDWPWHLVDSADLARCVCGARDPLRSLFDPSGDHQLRPWRLPRGTREVLDRCKGDGGGGEGAVLFSLELPKGSAAP